MSTSRTLTIYYPTDGRSKLYGQLIMILLESIVTQLSSKWPKPSLITPSLSDCVTKALKSNSQNWMSARPCYPLAVRTRTAARRTRRSATSRRTSTGRGGAATFAAGAVMETEAGEERGQLRGLLCRERACLCGLMSSFALWFFLFGGPIPRLSFHFTKGFKSPLKGFLKAFKGLLKSF